MIQTVTNRRNITLHLISWGLVLFGLYLASLYNYVLFHSLAEIFSIVVACSIFIVAWNSRRFLDNNYLLYIGVAYLFVGSVDLIHTLAYKGMGVFKGYDANLSTQLWILARYMESLSLLLAPLFLKRKLRINVELAAYALSTLLLLLSIFYWNIFPVCFVEGVGLTPFKKISEYIISSILGASIILLINNRRAFDRNVLQLVIWSIITTIISELSFTFYISVYGFSNLVGHYFKIISFYLIYKAITETGLTKPYNLLFRNLKQGEEALKKAHDELEIRVQQRTAELEIANQALQSEIIERKQAEEQLIKLFRAVEQSPVTVIITDIDANIEYVNPKFTQLTGYTFEEVIGKNPRILKSGEISPEEYKLLWETITSGREWRGEFHNKKKNGELYWESASISPIRNSKGDITHFLGVKEDITERKQAEKEMAVLQEQLRQSQKMEAIGRLAGGVAHDFNNLLTVIKGYSQLSLTEIKEGNPLRGNIEEIRNAADRAADLTRQLLAFSRRQIMELKVLDLNTISQNLEGMLHRLIGEDIELTILSGDDLGRVKVDPGQIEQVIMNLAVNAKDAMLKGGKLTIETANVVLDEEYARKHVAVKPGHYVMLSVSDTGTGMTPEVRERVFEPFFTTKQKGKGTGLGLSTVYGIVKQSGGNIWVYSELGRGTTFKIYLPQVDEAPEELTEKVETKEIPRGIETVLIVEDDKEVRKLAARILENQGYKVLEASQGSEALPLCKEYQKQIHLMLADVVMPGLDGRELADRVKSFHPGMKVLYMSGYTDNAIIHHGVLEKGMNYIQKPFTVDGLARRVREVIDKKSIISQKSGRYKFLSEHH